MSRPSSPSSPLIPHQSFLISHFSSLLSPLSLYPLSSIPLSSALILNLLLLFHPSLSPCPPPSHSYISLMPDSYAAGKDSFKYGWVTHKIVQKLSAIVKNLFRIYSLEKVSFPPFPIRRSQQARLVTKCKILLSSRPSTLLQSPDIPPHPVRSHLPSIPFIQRKKVNC